MKILAVLLVLVLVGCTGPATGPAEPCEWRWVSLRDSTGAYADSTEICISTDWSVIG